MAESQMPERTPGPWLVGEITGRMIIRDVSGMCDGGDYYSVAVTTAHSLLSDGEARANAAFIVEACNQYEGLKRRADLVEPLVEALRAAIRVADEAREEWDKAPSGMKAGKLLIALSDPDMKYRADITAIHTALSTYAAAVGSKEATP